MTSPSRIIDTHQHAFWHGRDDHGLVRDLDEQGIEYAWLLSWEIPPNEDEPMYHPGLSPTNVRPDGTHAGIPLRDLITARDRYPSRFVLGYCPNPIAGDAPGFLRAAAGIHGARVCGEWKFRILMDDPRCLELFRVAGELKMPVVFHIDIPYLPDAQGKRTYQRSWYGGTVENLERALQACPETTFIGHAPGFWREISASTDQDAGFYPTGPVRGHGRIYGLLDRYANLYADLSAGSGLNALKRDPANGKEFLLRYSDRLLFARDYYGGDLHQFLMSLDLPAAVLEKIYHQNAEKLVPRK